jgi:hypothetical protein
MALKAEDVLKAMDTLYDCLELNKIPHGIALSACVNIAMRILVKEGVNERIVDDVGEVIASALKNLNPNSYVERFDTHAK